MKRKLTEEQLELLEHVFSGGSFQSKDGLEVTILAGVELIYGDKNIPMTIANLLACRVYKTPEELRIEELERLLAKQQEVIQKLSKPKHVTRRPHLSVAEVREIEDAIAKGATSEMVQSTYQVSHTTYNRIVLHTHRHSKPLPMTSKGTT